jgi:hypothetical protein
MLEMAKAKTASGAGDVTTFLCMMTYQFIYIIFGEKYK